MKCFSGFESMKLPVLTNHSLWRHESFLLVWACRDHRRDDWSRCTGTNMTHAESKAHRIVFVRAFFTIIGETRDTILNDPCRGLAAICERSSDLFLKEFNLQ